ncbi:MAG: hypothetical protein ACE5NM_10810 [Sedimentisphaerales bacterium]
MKVKKILFYLLAALLGSCVPVMSLHPIYTEEDVVFEEKLLGIWLQQDPNNVWEFKRPDESEKVYELTLYENEVKKGVFAVRLAKLDERLLLDVHPTKFPSEQEDVEKMELPYNAFFFIPGHSFAIIDSIEPQLKIRWTTDDELEKLLKEEPDAVKHELVEDRVILTASTKQLQSFVLKYADDERVFTAKIVLSRQKSE